MPEVIRSTDLISIGSIARNGGDVARFKKENPATTAVMWRESPWILTRRAKTLHALTHGVADTLV
jgi:hypothetical protein